MTSFAKVIGERSYNLATLNFSLRLE